MLFAEQPVFSNFIIRHLKMEFFLSLPFKTQIARMLLHRKPLQSCAQYQRERNMKSRSNAHLITRTVLVESMRAYI